MRHKKLFSAASEEALARTYKHLGSIKKYNTEKEKVLYRTILLQYTEDIRREELKALKIYFESLLEMQKNIYCINNLAKAQLAGEVNAFMTVLRKLEELM